MAGVLSIPVRRPVATAMVFTALVLLGIAGWWRLPVELLPAVSGDELYVQFFRPGSDPELVEREILLPLEARSGEMPDVEETTGEVRGSAGWFTVRFRAGTDLKIRELELQRIASELARSQPEGTVVEVNAQDLSAMSRFVMVVQVVGGADRNSLRDLVEERVVPRLAAVSGVGRVMASGGAARELTVDLDVARAAALDVTPSEVIGALDRAVRRLRFVGGATDGDRRLAVMLDGRPRGVVSLGEVRIDPSRPVLLRHVADFATGPGREDVLLRVDGAPAVGLVVFQEEGANLVRLGSRLRARLDELRDELRPYGLDFVIGFDAAEAVQEQLERLERLALSGFGIALLVLLLFLRQLRAVAVVAVAVPVSLLAAVALLYVGGWSLNLITLFGLAVGVGMLVDNSIVVYEAVQRRLEHGVDPDRAAADGVRRTLRAILAATATNAVVFLPVAFASDQSVVRGLLVLMAVAILLPLAASLLVAVGLVPLLARHLAAPAALLRLRRERARRAAYAGLVRPDRPREVFSGLLMVALRRPSSWLVGVSAAVLLTVVIALPWVAVGTATQEPREADEVRMSIDLPESDSLESATRVFDRLEGAVRQLAGIERVESVIQEGGGSLTVRLVKAPERPAATTAAAVRERLRDAAKGLAGVVVRSAESAGGDGGEQGGMGSGGGLGALLGQSPAEVVVSGPDARQLERIAGEIQAGLTSLPEIGEHGAWVQQQRGPDEIRVEPRRSSLAAYALTADQVLPSLAVLRREGLETRVGMPLADGRELPLVVRTARGDRHARAVDRVRDLRLATTAGVLPVSELAAVGTTPPPPVIHHHNGRREVTVYYRLDDSAPRSGPARNAVDRHIAEAVRAVHRPEGTTVDVVGGGGATSWFKRVLIPILLLLYAVLAITFESLTMPVLVLVSVPLTVLGATWALVVAGMPADLMALVGVVALLGLTVNPAILLVDRMQQRVTAGGWSSGAAALAAVRERARPVLMTSCTTVAGLWPLALTSGREMEIWPPFATVVMGGLVTSTLLTLLVIPVGFVLLSRLDRIFGRLGPWIVLGWLAATAAVVAPLVVTGQVTSLTWQIVTTVLVAAALLGLAVVVLRRPERAEPDTAAGPPAVEVRFLRKVYGRPGPVGRAWRSGERFAARVLARGGRPFHPDEARGRALSLAVVGLGVGYLAATVGSTLWRVVLAFVLAALAARLLRELRRWRGHHDELGRVAPGGLENLLAAAAPWCALGWLVLRDWLLPRLGDERVHLTAAAVVLLTLLVALVQGGRATARAIAEGGRDVRVDAGPLRRTRTLWRRLSRAVFGFGLRREEVEALATVGLRVERGMIGVLGPNGAGKTTLLRLVAGILEPSLGVITIGGVRLERLRRHLARWVGYLPQDFGLPDNLTPREYLGYFALMYEIPAEERAGRIRDLLAEVGLAEKADSPIGGLSGGMRQRVAVARTLLRLPSVIIVDEPTVGLDPRERIRFRNLLARLAEGRVVLFSTHVVEDVAVACERVVVLSRGAIVFDGEPAALAHEAAGRVWQLRGDEQDLAAGARVVDRVPEPDGADRLRVLAEGPPAHEAAPVEPTLEDGYLWLVRGHGEVVGRTA